MHEKVLITLSAPGFPNETIDMDEVGTVTLTQNGCNISYSLPFAGSSFLRSGSIVGDTITFSGVAAVLSAGTTCSTNKMTATGTIINQGRIEMTTSVNIVCTKGAINLTGTGTGTVVFTRTVVLPPEIRTQPQDTTVTELDNAVFLCEFTGDFPAVDWHRKSPTGLWENIANTTLVESTLTSTKITIPRAAANLSGYQYRCILTNTGGQAFSDTPTLTVEPLPLVAPVITSGPDDSSVFESELASFSVTATGVPTPNVQWQLMKVSGGDWTNLVLGGTYLDVNSSRLIVASSVLEMTGDQFRCVVSNIVGSVTSGSATLSVLKQGGPGEPLKLAGIGAINRVDNVIPTGISDDGKTISGYTKVFATGKQEGFTWNESEGFHWFGGDHSFLNGISGDALVASGFLRDDSADPVFQAFFYWTELSGFVKLSATSNISRDGTAFPGFAGTNIGGTSGRNATFNVRTSGEFFLLGDLPGGATYATALDTSDDHLIVIGTGTDDDGAAAFRWTDATGMEGLGDSSLGNFPSSGAAISGDGSTIVGSIVLVPNSGYEAYRWTETTGMTVLEEFEDAVYTLSHQAFDVSSDGSRIVGYSGRLDGPTWIRRAVYWNEFGRIFDFNQLVVNEGISLDGWVLEQALALSPDGNVVVGTGTNNDPEKGSVWILSGLNGTGDRSGYRSINIGDVSLRENGFQVGIQTQRGWLYVLQKSGDLGTGNWAIVSLANGSGDIMSLIDAYSESEGNQFFRIVGNELPPSSVPDGFVVIPSGEFLMGSPDTEPGRIGNEVEHEVLFTKKIYMAKTEVVWEQWNEVRSWALQNGYDDIFIGYSGLYEGGAFENQPVTRIHWRQAVKWCNAFSEYMGRTPVYHSSPEMNASTVIRGTSFVSYLDEGANGFRLPTEAEWEYACRAGSTTAFSNGALTNLGSNPLDPNLDRVGWYEGNFGLPSHAVGLKEPNAWGLYDMHGNVAEWCGDAYVEDLGSERVINPEALFDRSNHRVQRGGSWSSDSELTRSASRISGKTSTAYVDVGFRVVANIAASVE